MSTRTSQDSAAQKRRGRPQKESSPEEESLKLRRERNRQAQQVFRIRKQAAQLEQEQQIQKLEDTIEQMSSVFLGFSDDLLQSDSIVRDPGLMRKLREAIRRTVTLARAEPSSDMQLASLESSPGAQNQSGASASGSQYYEEQLMDVDGLPLVYNTSATGVSPNASPQKDSLDEMLIPIESAPLSHNLSNAVTQTNSNPTFSDSSILNGGLLSFDTSVFGNGWTNDLPISYTRALHKQPIDTRSLSLKIVRSTLQTAYYCIMDTAQLSSVLGKNMFEFSLRQHSREELAFNIRWFLGPGNTEIFRLSDVEYGKVLPKEKTASITLHPDVDLYAIGEEEAKQTRGSLGPFKPFVNADEVEGYLNARGARYVDEDILELEVGVDPITALPSVELFDHNVTARGFDPQRQFLNSDIFFPGTQMQDTSLQEFVSLARLQMKRVRISQWLLMRHLADISVCLTYGPAYHKDDLDKAIANSVIG